MNPKQLVRGHFVLRADALNPASVDTQQLASQALRAEGLNVTRSSPLAITVEGDSETFEKAFQTTLADENGTISWKGSPVIPDKLQDLIIDVVFPKPVKLS